MNYGFIPIIKHNTFYAKYKADFKIGNNATVLTHICVFKRLQGHLINLDQIKKRRGNTATITFIFLLISSYEAEALALFTV